MSLLASPKRLAKLLASVNVSHFDRPLTPIEVAKEIKKLQTELSDNKNELNKRLSLSPSIIADFLRLLKLPKQIQDIIVWGRPNKDSGEISFTAARHIAKFNDKKDILKVVGTIHSLPKSITSKEVQNIISIRQTNPDKPIEQCIKETLDVSRPKLLEYYIFISGIKPIIVNMLHGMASNQNTNLNDCAKTILMKTLPRKSIQSINIHNDYLRVTLTKEGIDYIHRYADSFELSRKDVFNDIFEKLM